MGKCTLFQTERKKDGLKKKTKRKTTHWPSSYHFMFFFSFGYINEYNSENFPIISETGGSLVLLVNVVYVLTMRHANVLFGLSENRPVFFLN